MYNAITVVRNTKIIGINPKKILPREGVHYESRWFETGQFLQSQEVMLLGQKYPFGDFRYQCGGVGIAIEICEEAWRAEAAAANHARAGVEIIMNPSASHFSFGKYKTRETMVSNSSRSMQVFFIHSNLVGLEAGRIIYDGGALIAECGKIIARGPRFGFKDSYLTIKDLQLDRARVGKLRNRSERAELRLPSDELVIQSHEKWEDVSAHAIINNVDRIHTEAKQSQWTLSKEEEFLAAEMMGLFDYWRKSHSMGFVLSLSGGCDSAATAVLVAHMIHSSLRELGGEELKKRLSIQNIADSDINNPHKWLENALTTVYQATENSSQTTSSAAKSLANELNSEHLSVDVQDIVDCYVKKANQSLNITLGWREDDIALQNIQARSRSPMVWLIANIKGALLLATSNRSEASVGYATMDGDTSGGLAPLGGIDKYFLRKWLIWAEKECQWGQGPLQSLETVNSQAPTAELRPRERKQEDEEDLMPYSILNRMEYLLVRDLNSPSETLDILTSEYPNYTRDDLKFSLIRFLKLWSRNQWKRERYAPSFLLDSISLDPKTWCRFPILSGGFASEIEKLMADT